MNVRRVCMQFVLFFLSYLPLSICGMLVGIVIGVRAMLHKSSHRLGSHGIVAMERPGFSRDLDILEEKEDLFFIRIRKDIVGCVLERIFDPSFKRQVFFVHSRDDSLTTRKRKAEYFFSVVIFVIGKFYSIGAVVSANINYWQDDSLISVCKEKKIPFVVLCRECANTELVEKWTYYLHRVNKFKFRGDKVLVWSERMSRAYVMSGACSSEQTVVTGCPRMDVYLDDDRSDKDTVVLLAFHEPEYNAPNAFVETLRMFAKLSLLYKDYSFVVQCKHEITIDPIRRLLIDVQNRVIVKRIANMSELIRKAKLVVGFNSVGLIEGLAARSLVGVPRILDSIQNEDELIINDRRKALSKFNQIHFFQTIDDLKQIMAQKCAPQIDYDLISDFFQFDASKTATKLVADELRGYLR